MIGNVAAKAFLFGISVQLLLPVCCFAETKKPQTDVFSAPTVLSQQKIKRLSANAIKSVYHRSRDVSSDAQAALDKISQGDWAGAIQSLNLLLDKDPQNSDALALRSIARYNVNTPPVNDINYAYADINEALDINPKSVMAYVFRAQIKLGIGDTDGAIRDCNRALQLEQNALAYSIRGQAELWNGDIVPSMVDEDRALTIKPDMTDAWKIKGSGAIALGDATTALDYYNKIAKIDANDPEAYVGLARASLFLDKYNDALTNLNLAVKLDPNYAEAYQFRAFANMALGNQPGFLADAQKFAQLAPNTPSAHRILAYAYEGNNEADNALAQYKTAAQLYDLSDDSNRDEMLCSAKRLQNNTVASGSTR